MWVLVKVDHGSADKVLIEFYASFEQTLERAKSLQSMILETGELILEQNDINDCDCGFCDSTSEYWWNVTFQSGALVTIDAKPCTLSYAFS